MDGWSSPSNPVDKSRRAEDSFDPENSKYGSGDASKDTLRGLFDKILMEFSKEMLKNNVIRPFPALLGDGRCVDLLKLYSTVRDHGGYESVTKKGLWSSLSKEIGLNLDSGSAVKLIYVKYLYSLDRWLHGHFMNTEESRGLSSSKLMNTECEASNQNKDDASPFRLELDKTKSSVPYEVNDVEEIGHNPLIIVDDDGEAVILDSNSKKQLECDTFDKREDDPRPSVLDSKRSKCMNHDIERDQEGHSLASKRKPKILESDIERDQEGHSLASKSKRNILESDCEILKSSGEGGHSSLLKGKCESFSRMLDWIKGTAANPCDPDVWKKPENPELKVSEISDLNLIWNQALLARKVLFLWRQPEKESILQQKRKIHPSLYEDDCYGIEHTSKKVRYSERLLSRLQTNLFSLSKTHCVSSKESGRLTSESDIPKDDRATIRVGSLFQADVPTWTHKTTNISSCDDDNSKWLGARMWSPNKHVENNELILRYPIGKGRPDSCNCRCPHSTECVEFHMSEERTRLKLELGPIFHAWRFNQMGEALSATWTEDEQTKFKDTIRQNPPSKGWSFWGEIYDCFPYKSRQNLVSYYFNVFQLRRRRYQNTVSPSHVDSDDDETEFIS